ncbi:MAG: SdpI family protein [Chitinophagaceae bacterium]
MKRLLNLTAWLAIVAPGAYLISIWNDLPVKVPMHFDFQGNPDRFGSKTELVTMVIIFTVMAAAIHLFFPLIYKIDPKKSAPENKARLKKLGFAITLLLSFISFFIIYSSRSGSISLNANLLVAVLGAFWCILGNYMFNLKPNYFAGMRLPWTLHDEENWKETHRLAGKLWFAGGIVIFLLAFLLPSRIVLAVFICITMVITLIPMIYSYRLYRQKQKNIPQP